MTPGITVVVPTIPSRAQLFQQAIKSVAHQTHKAAAISVAVDIFREGAPATRQRALDAVNTDWVAFLDDDDMFKNRHLEVLMNHAQETGADFVYSWFEVPGGSDPFPATHFTNPFDPQDPIETTITVLVRTGLAKTVGFKALEGRTLNTGEDRYFTLGCLEAGANISHVVDKTWYWRHHSGNTSGLPTKGDSLGW